MRLDQCMYGQLVLWLRTPKAPHEPQAFVPAVVDPVLVTYALHGWVVRRDKRGGGA